MKNVAGYACACAAALAAADDTRARADDEVIVVEGVAPDRDADPAARDRERALGEAPFVTVLHPDEHAASASVADAIATSAGAQTRSLGGTGAFQSVSVRGAAPGHTTVLVDGVPLARIAAVTTDLGRFSLASFGEVDVYRGSVPVELGGAGVGGAVNLVTRLGRGERGERVHASVGGGSFGARHVRLHYGDDHGSVKSSTAIGYQGATGDYSYFSDGGTPLNPGDDAMAVRRNNGFDQLDLASRAGDAERVAGVRVAWKRQGLPGSVANPAFAATLATLDVIADGRVDVAVGSATARQLAYALVETQQLRDPDAELGLGTQDRAYVTLSGGASSTWSMPIGRRVHGTAGLELRGDRFRDRDASGGRQPLVGTRAALAPIVAADVALGDVTLTPAVRVDVVRTAPTPATEGPDAFANVPTRWDVVPSPRLTAKVALDADVAAKASAGYYVRLPTLLELFGDRGTIVGAPGLRPERGPSADVGIVWAPGAARGQGVLSIDRIFVEAAAFATRATDTIALVSTAGFVARAQNIGTTQTYGGELVASARVARALAVTLRYTRLFAAQRSDDPNLDGKLLPRTPGHLAYARAELAQVIAGRAAGVWLDAAVQSTAYLDEANSQRVPARALVGTGARVELGAGLALALAVENVADTRVVELPAERAIDMPTPTALVDLAGYPLPGRTFYLAVEWTH